MLFLADTSIWIDHFRKTDATLREQLGRRNILHHPFVLGEIALGHVPNLDGMIGDFRDLPRAPVADAEEVLQLILHNKLQQVGWSVVAIASRSLNIIQVTFMLILNRPLNLSYYHIVKNPTLLTI